MMTEISLRPGGPADADWLLGLFDEAVAWMVARGQSKQWGDEPLSQTEAGRATASRLCDGGGLRVAAIDGQEVAALVVGDHPRWVDPISEPELYIELLLVSRRHAGRRIGEALVDAALDEARAQGAAVVRVDCWAGAPPLVAWYEARGFQRTATFTVKGDWVGQIFALRL
jgi:ribosomal protein S18 acetylase RimI-like enzyme